MIRRRAVVGLSMLCALLVCALAAQSASGATAVNTTAFTCVKAESGAGFSDEHCDNEVSKEAKFKHEVVPLNETKSINATNEEVTNSTKDHETAVLKGKLACPKSK